MVHPPRRKVQPGPEEAGDAVALAVRHDAARDDVEGVEAVELHLDGPEAQPGGAAVEVRAVQLGQLLFRLVSRKSGNMSINVYIDNDSSILSP